MHAFGVAIVAATLVLGTFALGAPAQAATPGFHAAFFSESSFLTLGAGQTGQFSVGFTNTGDQPWVKGVANSQASLHTAAPLDNPLDFVGGWSSGWRSANVYTVQSSDLVAPGQVGFFIYSVQVPANAAFGPHTFYGRPSIDGVGYLEDYGYYQVLNVQGAIALTGVSPASPSSQTKPTVSGTGATGLELVNVLDGPTGPIVGTGAADAQGVFSITLTTALASGTHSLVAQSATKGTSGPLSYVVNATLGPVMTGISATSLSSLTVTFSSPMKCATTPGRNDITNITNYFTNVLPSGNIGPAVSTAVASTDCTQVTLTLSSTLTINTQYRLVAYFVQDSSANTINSSSNTIDFDTVASNLSTWAAKQDGTLTLTFTKGMSTIGGSTGGNSILNPSNYQIDTAVAASTTTISCLNANCAIVRLQLVGGSSGPLGLASSVHTFQISNVVDAANGGQFLVPNPTSRQATTQP